MLIQKLKPAAGPGLVAATLTLAATSLAAAPEPSLRITGAEVHCDAAPWVVLHGDFGGIQDTPSLVLDLPLPAGPTELWVLDSSPTSITAELQGCDTPGTYRLTVVFGADSDSATTTSGKVRPPQFFSTLDLTLGAPGPAGPAGPTGPAGPAGPTGPAGPPGSGLSGYEQVTSDTTIPGNLGRGSVFWVEAQCPAGKKVLGGGIRMSGLVDTLEVLRVFESQPSSATAWRAAAIYVGPLSPSPPADSVTLKAFAVCAWAN